MYLPAYRVTGWEPFSGLRALQREMDSLLDGYTAKKENPDAELPQDRPVFVPPTDIYETEKAIFLRCSMPGVGSDSLEVVLEGNVLTLTGHQKWKTPDDFQLVHQEYETGVLRRSFRIPEEIDRSGIKAVMKDGVLNLELPKSPRAQPKKIKVETIS